MPDPPEAASDPGSLAEEFWAFSLALYAHPSVAAACLHLQDEHGLDVNVLLLCCWMARSGRGRLSEAALAAAEARAASWRADVLTPLRAARRALNTMSSPGGAALYAEVKRVELAAEREEQRRLVDCWLDPPSPSFDRGRDEDVNLTLYFTAHGLAPGLRADLISTLRTIG